MGKAIIAFILSVGVGTWLSFFNHGIGVVVSISIIGAFLRLTCGTYAEQNRAKAAMQNRGAKERAEEVKAAFLEAAKQIPADQRQEILDRMGQQKEIPTMGRLQYYQAEAEARRQLDTALKQEAQTRERNRTHDRDRGI